MGYGRTETKLSRYHQIDSTEEMKILYEWLNWLKIHLETIILVSVHFCVLSSVIQQPPTIPFESDFI